MMCKSWKAAAIVTGLLACIAALSADEPKAARLETDEQTRRINAQVATVQKFIANQRETAQKAKRTFAAPTDQQLKGKLSNRRVLNPAVIVSQSWTPSAATNGEINYVVGIYNPGPNRLDFLYANVFVGPANAVEETGAALLTADLRFPRLNLPAGFGLTLEPEAMQTLEFNLRVPTGIDATNYFGNTFLSQVNLFGVGRHLDRSAFPFAVQ